MEGEKHRSWLIDHLDGIKETLEKELIDLQDDLKDPFEMNYNDTSEEQLMEEIRKMEAQEETENQNANLQATPVYPGARLTIGISALLVMAVVLRHSLTGPALNDILKLIWLHCLGSSEARKSMNALKKCFYNCLRHWHFTGIVPIVLCPWRRNMTRSAVQTLSAERTSLFQAACRFFVEVPIMEQVKKLLL